MPRRASFAPTSLGPLESEVMGLVWRYGRQTVADVAKRLNKRRPQPLDYRTVLTVMSRLRAKGLLRHDQVGNAYHFSPTCSREEFGARQGAATVNQLVRQYGDAAIAGIVDQLSSSPGAIAHLNAVLPARAVVKSK